MMRLLLLPLVLVFAACDERSADVSIPGIHPEVFTLVECWLSDTREPVVTEINLDAVAENRNQFGFDRVREDRGWVRCDREGPNGFSRYRILESDGQRHVVEFQDNGGGTLTTSAIIGFEIQDREVMVEGRPETIRVMRVLSFRDD